jgi:hypothetical protein
MLIGGGDGGVRIGPYLPIGAVREIETTSKGAVKCGQHGTEIGSVRRGEFDVQEPARHRH